MQRSVLNFNTEMIRGGKAAGIAYCQAWKAEISAANAMLSTQLAAKKIDLTGYNIKMSELNKQAKDLNTCVASVNKAK